jgi:hypothetical protein
MLMNKKTHYLYRRVDAACVEVRYVLNGFFKRGEKTGYHNAWQQKEYPTGFSEKEKEVVHWF